MANGSALIPDFWDLFLSSFYAAIFVWLMLRTRFFSGSGMGRRALLVAFGIKLPAGFLYALIHLKTCGGGDTLVFYNASHMIYEVFFDNPLYFLEMTLGPNMRTPPEHLKIILDPIPFWSDMRNYTMLRINAWLQFLSLGSSYHVHVVVWEFLSFAGLVGIYRTFAGLFPEKRGIIYACCFLTPSVVFWGSGLHKEGLSLFCLGIFVYSLYRLLYQNGRKSRYLPYMILCGLLLFMLRYYLLLLLLPAALLWVATKKSPGRALPKYLAGYAFGLLLLVVPGKLSPRFNVFSRLAETQYYYINYSPGRGDIPIPTLEANAASFAKASPNALFNAMLRPTFADSYNLLTLAAAAETFAMLLFALTCITFAGKSKLRNQEFLLFCLFFSLTLFLLVGLIVDNLGPIVRYRSVALPFWLSSLACIFDPKRPNIITKPIGKLMKNGN